VEEGEGELIGPAGSGARRTAGNPAALAAPAAFALAALAALAAFAVLAILAGTACSPREEEPAAPPAASLSTADLAAIEARLAAGDGVRVINFWAMWCQPCVAELPEFAALDRSIRPRGIRVIGVSLDLAVPGDHARIESRLSDFLRQRGISYENLLYTGNVSSLLDAFDLPGSIPYTIIVADDGSVIWRHEGATTRERIEAALVGEGE
jgi:thiol-disulfide isomerase/thioredoxin